MKSSSLMSVTPASREFVLPVSRGDLRSQTHPCQSCLEIAGAHQVVNRCFNMKFMAQPAAATNFVSRKKTQKAQEEAVAHVAGSLLQPDWARLHGLCQGLLIEQARSQPLPSPTSKNGFVSL